jgi:hypothetical protein
VIGVEDPANTVDGVAAFVTTKLAAVEDPPPPEPVGPLTMMVTCTVAPWQAF